MRGTEPPGGKLGFSPSPGMMCFFFGGGGSEEWGIFLRLQQNVGMIQNGLEI